MVTFSEMEVSVMVDGEVFGHIRKYGQRFYFFPNGSNTADGRGFISLTRCKAATVEELT